MARTTNHAVKVAVLETRMEAVEKGLSSIETKLDAALAAQAKYKGFWGGILMVVSALWYVLTQFWPFKGNQ